MRPLVSWLLAILVSLLAVAGIAAGYLFAFYPRVAPAEDVRVAVTPERLARGAYLFNHVSVCVNCHGEPDWTKYAGPVKPGTEGAGGHVFDDELAGLPGDFYGRNVTPAGVGTWTDGELIRAITSGVTRDGTPLFPLMPYTRYRVMDREDIEAIVAYMRSLRPIEKTVPERSLHFPMQLLIRTMPMAPSHHPRPSPDDRLAYGRYLANAAACGDCHTPMDDRGQFLEDKAFSGGNEFRFAVGGLVRSANLTPDADTGIGAWSEAQFVQTFKVHEGVEPRALSPAEQRENTVMPWISYSGMSEQDLGAIYTFLRSVSPIVNRVTKYE